MKKFFVVFGGGLGDVFEIYFRGRHGWGYVESAKELMPDAHIKLLASTHNPQTLEFIKYNPFIDQAQDFGWVKNGNKLWNKHRDGAIRLYPKIVQRYGLKFKRPKIYTNEEDDQVIDKISKAGKFIILHPFAGSKDRIVLPTNAYNDVIDYVIDDRGFNVVAIGGTYKRNQQRNSRIMEEEFDYERPGLFNLVGKSNVRVIAKLVQKTSLMVANWSAFSCLAWVNNKQTITTVCNSSSFNMEHLIRKIGPGGKWAGAPCKSISSPNNILKPNQKEIDRVQNKLIRTIKSFI